MPGRDADSATEAPSSQNSATPRRHDLWVTPRPSTRSGGSLLLSKDQRAAVTAHLMQLQSHVSQLRGQVDQLRIRVERQGESLSELCDDDFGGGTPGRDGRRLLMEIQAQLRSVLYGQQTYNRWISRDVAELKWWLTSLSEVDGQDDLPVERTEADANSLRENGS
ncbi:hypothetical protein K461DRAFT_165640 [Myriangium duriaei CBS 260.36]|uniref:Uncharacterized protein n=1 Tax=Myriangium duriaei CBS 260.36 TaxID=1168546 RepID=A0A9P4MKR6_9PEZI|nr:hypothetical protein K461DRAFT_165640 [Myriangium duriaei CBS 260.36]